jgi:hypothetical protein
MPKAFSTETRIAARKAPATEPRPPMTTTTKDVDDDAQVHLMVHGLARQLQRAAERGEKDAERKDAGEQPFLIDAEGRDHLAVLGRGAHQHAPARAVEQQPQRRRAPAGRGR